MSFLTNELEGSQHSELKHGPLGNLFSHDNLLFGWLKSDIGALAKKSNDNALSLVFKIANE